MLLDRILSALLGYPDAELRAALPEISAALSCADIAPEEHAVLVRFIEELSKSDPIASEEDYVRTFDMVPEHSLHLTHHLIGEDKNRGPALIDLAEFYKDCGVEIVEKELPDYLPLVLEFVSVLEEDEGRMFLWRWNKVLRQLQANLAAVGSPYADLVGIVEQRSRVAEAGSVAETVQAAQKTDPWLADGDFDPPIRWNEAPTASSSGCRVQP